MVTGIFLILLSVVSILLSGFNVESNAAIKPPKAVCIEEYETIWKDFNQKILTDIVEGYNLDLENFKELTMNDLLSKMKTGEKNEDIQSLLRLFEGTSLGNKRLFLNGNRGLLFFKRTDGVNVLQTIEQSSINGKWIVAKTKELQGNIMKWEKFDWSKCDEE